MPSVRIGNDGGDVINVSGVLYSKHTGQPSSGAIDTVPTTINIVGKTWNYDDNNVSGGSEHRTWTACEMGICQYGTGNQATATFAAANVYVAFYTAPSDGTLKFYGQIASNETCDLAINGILVYHTSVPLDTFNNCRALRVSSGDVITIAPNINRPGNLALGYFLPNVYP